MVITLFSNNFFNALNISNDKDLLSFSKKTNIPVSKLKFYNSEGIFPFEDDLKVILSELDITELELKLKLGVLDNSTVKKIMEHYIDISKILDSAGETKQKNVVYADPVFSTNLGKLYQDDCLSVIDNIPNSSVDLIFADPPFNLNKVYESNINDKLTKEDYLNWTEKWILGCIDLLKEGGSFLIWNLPIWNTYISSILNKYLNFRHWITVDIKYQLPIPKKLYPSHYSLLYYTKGKKPTSFNNQRIPLEICRHCSGDIKDYGGYKNKLNVNGLNLTDVWRDISPVRHSKYKTRESNELPLKLMERIISMASDEGDMVFDPFGGSGTTYIVCEILNRKWIGSEIGPVDSILNRFNDISFHKKQIDDIQKNKNVLFTEDMKKARIKNNHWLPETLINKTSK